MTQPGRSLHLRVVWAIPQNNGSCWRLFLDELGYAPDFVVADAGTGIARAGTDQFDPTVTTFVPSLWHVGQAVRTKLADTSGALLPGPTGKRLAGDLGDHVALLARDAGRDEHAWTGLGYSRQSMIMASEVR